MVRDNTYVTKLRINVATNKDNIRYATPILMTNTRPFMEGLQGQNPFPRNVQEGIQNKYIFLENTYLKKENFGCKETSIYANDKIDF
jgi:hypothetical protein